MYINKIYFDHIQPFILFYSHTHTPNPFSPTSPLLPCLFSPLYTVLGYWGLYEHGWGYLLENGTLPVATLLRNMALPPATITYFWLFREGWVLWTHPPFLIQCWWAQFCEDLMQIAAWLTGHGNHVISSRPNFKELFI